MSADPQNNLQEAGHNTVHTWRFFICMYLALAGGTWAVFASVAGHEFVDYDDGPMIFDNPRVSQGLTLDGLKFAFTGPHAANWQPLTTLSHQLDCQLFGVTRPGLHHMVSLGLHVATVLLLFEALRRMTGDVWPSALVAALFAIHPLHVESVAWASARKDMLSGLFWMLTLLAYVRYARRPGIGTYLLVCLAFGLGLMSKPMLVTLPCVLLLLDWWPLGRWRSVGPAAHLGSDDPARFPVQETSRLVLEKLPLLAAAAIVASVTTLVQSSVGATASVTSLPVPWRLINAAVAYVFYLWKTIWPTGLAVLYPHPGLAQSADIGPWVLAASVATVLLLGITFCAIRWAWRRPYLLVGWLWYLGTLVPVIGLVQVGEQAYADRYTYLPLVGVYIMIAWGVCDLVRCWPVAKYPVALCGSLSVACLMVVAWNQVAYWRESQTLFEHTLQVVPDNPKIHNNLGRTFYRKGQFKEAVAHYQEALQLKPNDGATHNNLGTGLQVLGQFDEAVAHYEEALRLKPNFPQAHNNWGRALQDQGRLDEAIVHYQEALRLDPKLAPARHSWGAALQRLGRPDDAIVHYKEALRLQPNYAEAHFSWGVSLQRLRRPDEAVEHYQEALRIKPDYAEAHSNCGSVLQGLGRFDEAVAHYQEALRLNPNLARAHCNWGIALDGLGRPDAAIVHYQEALRIKPDYVEAHNRLGTALAALGRFKEALTHYDDAVRHGPRQVTAANNLAWLLATCPDPDVRDGNRALEIAERLAKWQGAGSFAILDTLSAAHAEAGRFEEAVRFQEKAVELAPDAQKNALTRRLELYKQGEPYREKPQAMSDM